LEDQGVTVAEWVVIRQMFELGESAPSLVAESIGMTRGAVSKLIDRLIDKGLVSRESASGDRRYQKVALTDAGFKLTPKLAEIADSNDSKFFGSLSEESRTLLLDILQELVRTHELKEMPTK
jgi:DNA-binding MarR family transcriptional regulator